MAKDMTEYRRTEYRKWAVKTIREYWYYETGALEAMTDDKLKETIESLIDWLAN